MALLFILLLPVMIVIAIVASAIIEPDDGIDDGLDYL